MRSSWLGVMLLVGCAPSREGYVKDEIIGAARYGELTVLDEDLRLAICGFRPETKFEGAKVSTTFVGDDKKGTGEVKVAFLPAKGASGYGCEGTVAFDYEFHPRRKAPAYYALTDVRRIGAPAAFVATMEAKATRPRLVLPARRPRHHDRPQYHQRPVIHPPLYQPTARRTPFFPLKQA